MTIGRGASFLFYQKFDFFKINLCLGNDLNDTEDCKKIYYLKKGNANFYLLEKNVKF